MYTSNYRISGNNPNAVAISVYPPKSFMGRSLKMLAPNWKDVKDIRNGVITEHQYAINYFNKLDNLELTAAELVAMLPTDSILLCYEDPFDFCHRRLVAMWIENETGVIIPELLPDNNYKKQQTFIDTTLDF